jgi:hypothetical protein
MTYSGEKYVDTYRSTAVMLSTGADSEVTRRIAAPMVGGWSRLLC